MALPAKEELIKYFINHPFKYFEIGTCEICKMGDLSLFANRSGMFRHGSTCRCEGKNGESEWDLLDYYLDPKNEFEKALKEFMQD